MQKMKNENKYKIEVEWDEWNAAKQKREVIPLPKDKVTGIHWDELIKVIAENGVLIAKEIRLHNIGKRQGTRMLNREELFSLWQGVDAYRQKARASLDTAQLV